MKKTKQRRCRICNKSIEEIENRVCDAYVTYVCEEGFEYECYNCFYKRIAEELEKERYLTTQLKGIILKQ